MSPILDNLTDDELRLAIAADIRVWPANILVDFVIDNFDLPNCSREMLLMHADDLDIANDLEP